MSWVLGNVPKLDSIFEHGVKHTVGIAYDVDRAAFLGQGAVKIIHLL